jgi:hypothetical protein
MLSSDINRRRDEIEGATAGRTLCDELRRVAETCGDVDATFTPYGLVWVVPE